MTLFRNNQFCTKAANGIYHWRETHRTSLKSFWGDYLILLHTHSLHNGNDLPMIRWVDDKMRENREGLCFCHYSAPTASSHTTGLHFSVCQPLQESTFLAITHCMVALLPLSTTFRDIKTRKRPFPLLLLSLAPLLQPAAQLKVPFSVVLFIFLSLVSLPQPSHPQTTTDYLWKPLLPFPLHDLPATPGGFPSKLYYFIWSIGLQIDFPVQIMNIYGYFPHRLLYFPCNKDWFPAVFETRAYDLQLLWPLADGWQGLKAQQEGLGFFFPLML